MLDKLNRAKGNDAWNVLKEWESLGKKKELDRGCKMVDLAKQYQCDVAVHGRLDATKIGIASAVNYANEFGWDVDTIVYEFRKVLKRRTTKKRRTINRENKALIRHQMQRGVHDFFCE